MEKEKKNKILLYSVGGILTANLVRDVVVGIKDETMKGKTDATLENTIGYENINTRFNTKVHTNNFVVLHIKRKEFNDITAISNKLNKCRDEGISVTLVLDSDPASLENVYSDIDFLESILRKYNIDMPIYLNIDKIMSNKKLNSSTKKELVSAFLDKMGNSSFRIGLYGYDSNLCDLNNYLIDITSNSVFLVKDSEEVKYVGDTDIVKSLDGSIKASSNLSIINDSNITLPCSAGYVVSEGDTIHSIALKCGLSEEDIIKYNNIKDVKVGDIVYIPNLYEVIDSSSNEVFYNFGVFKGIDISDYQDNIDWNRVKETSDFVITEIARIKSDTYLDTVTNHIENILSNNIDLGLYICLGGIEEESVVSERISNYLDRLDSELNDKNINIDKSVVPIFIDFELDNIDIEYYKISSKFKELCNKHGFNKVGIYGNSNTLSLINTDFKNNNDSLNNSDFYIWMAGGLNYEYENNWVNKGYKLSELEEVTNTSNSEYDIDIRQVTNVCIDTGASNSMGHCDVNFLYNDEVFNNVEDSDEEEYIEYLEVDLNRYKNVPVETVIHGVQNSLTFFTALGYSVLFIKMIGKKLILSIKKRKLINDEIKKQLKK